MFIKTRTKHASKDGIELAVFESFGEVLVEALSFGLGVAELVLVRWLAVCSSTGSPSFTPWSTTHTNKHTIKKQTIKDLSLSSNQE